MSFLEIIGSITRAIATRRNRGKLYTSSARSQGEQLLIMPMSPGIVPAVPMPPERREETTYAPPAYRKRKRGSCHRANQPRKRTSQEQTETHNHANEHIGGNALVHGSEEDNAGEGDERGEGEHVLEAAEQSAEVGELARGYHCCCCTWC